MEEKKESIPSLSIRAARNLATTTKTIPQMTAISPRWLLKMLPWVNVEAGTYRVNRKKIITPKDLKINISVGEEQIALRSEHLSALASFFDLDENLTKAFIARFEIEKFDIGQKPISIGENVSFFVIAKGKVEIFTTGSAGQKIVLKVLSEGHFFGDLSLIGELPGLIYAQALSPCVLLSIKSEQFRKIMDGDPEIKAGMAAARKKREAQSELSDEYGEKKIRVSSAYEGEPDISETFIDYEDDPQEYPLSIIQSIVTLHTRVTDLYNNPINQLREQLRLTIEAVKEQQEREMICNPEYGLLNAVSSSMHISTRNGSPTPDDMDELLSRVWKKPSYFVAHPYAVAAFGRECTRRGVPPVIVEPFGSPFLSWRGVPIVPSDKVPIVDGISKILLMRTGENDQGVVGLHQLGIPDEVMPGLSVRFMGINKKSIASYLVTAYFSVAVLVEDALGVLDNVAVSNTMNTNDSDFPGVLPDTPDDAALDALARRLLTGLTQNVNPFPTAASAGLPTTAQEIKKLFPGDAPEGASAVQTSGDTFRELYGPASATTDSRYLFAQTSSDIAGIRKDFPALHQKVNGRNLVWLDNAATTQKPRLVIETLRHYYEQDNSNIHRGAHTLARRATDRYEEAREKVQRFIGAGAKEEIIFVRGTTEAVNLVAQSYGRKYVGEGDEILVTQLEHHSNIIPWQMLAREKKAVLKVIPVSDDGEILLDAYERLLGPRTKMIAIAHVSNAVGAIAPVEAMIAQARRYGAKVLIDGAQAVPHFRVNMQTLDADFFAFSGHKLFGPTGIGVLYGKAELLRDMPPWQGGGSMIKSVSWDQTVYNDIPQKFEAGTNNIAGAIGLGAAIDYLNGVNLERLSAHEHALMTYAIQALSTVKGLRHIGNAPHKVGALSFVIDGHQPEDIGRYLDQEGIAVRAGHHCAQPAMARFNVTSTVRPSLAFYNTREEIDLLVYALKRMLNRRSNALAFEL